MKKKDKEAVNEFVAIVGGKTWERTACDCTGKWRGTTDYGFVMDGRIEFFVSNGMASFETKVRKWSKAIRTFQKKKDYYLSLLRTQVEKDNVNATSEGFQHIRLIDIGILSPECSSQYDFFASYVMIEINGRQFKHHTTGLNCYIMADDLETYLDECNSRKIYTAGGVRIPDYLFCGVRFCSYDGLYKIGV